MNTSRLIKRLNHQPIDRMPVWFMRQAGRFHPDYRALRSNYENFMTFCYDADAASKATLIPIQAYPEIDAAIIFSDILTIPDALGLDVSFVKDHGPRISGSLDPLSWQTNVTDQLSPVYDAIAKTRAALPSNKSLIGFCGAPWTLLVYSLDGANKNQFPLSRASAIANDQTFQKQLEIMTEAVIDHAKAQLAAGCDTIMLFDSWSGVLSENEFLRCCIEPLAHITSQLRELAPVTVFLKGQGQYIHHWQHVNANCYGIDFTTTFDQAMRALPEDAIVQGNLDPSLLIGHPELAVEKIKSIIQHPMSNRMIFNVGHGILPTTKPENLSYILERFTELTTTEAT